MELGGSVCTTTQICKNMIQPTKMFIGDKQFVKEQSIKTAIVGHHTAGGHNPINQINTWESDKIGRIATAYVIGGISITNPKETMYDGEVFQAFDEKYSAFHLGIIGNGNRFDYQSIGIEICNYGYLVRGKDNRFYNYVSKPVPEDMVVDLGYYWRGYRYWHKYTEKQINSFCNLISDISIRNQISILKKMDFEYNPQLLQQNKIVGLYTHVNFRKDKFDLSPQPNLIKALNSL